MTDLLLMRISGPWTVQSIPLDAAFSPEAVSFEDALTAPECAHLQTVLYTDQPYWGERIRAINQSAWVYRKTFTTPDEPFKRARLHFEGVDYFCEVWLNGQRIGEHEGHFVPFCLDATAALNAAGEDNELLVRVWSPWDEPNPGGNYPTDHVLRGLVKGLYEHGEGLIPPDINTIGIWRPVHVVLDDGLSVDHIQVRTELDGATAVRVTVTNATGNDWQGTLRLNVAADNHDGPGTTLATGRRIPPGTHYFDETLTIREPQWWWPYDHGEPNLYALTVQLQDADGTVLSEQNTTFGIRTVELKRTPERFIYLVNGRPVYVRGSSYMPGIYMSQVDEDSLARDVQLAKDTNLNLLRVHVHVAPPELYALCDREGVLVWQDFELSWIHDPSPEFETRALALQRAMMVALSNHPSIMTWCCHNEPTMLFTRRQNLERHPDPALYADALEQDPTRPVFICSGQVVDDWQRSGDTHSYYGAMWTKNYTDVYKMESRLASEFGFEAPAAEETLRKHDYVWDRLNHLEGKIDTLWDYQAELTQYHIEHFRRLRAAGCAGYVHFWLVDLVPQIGCGVLDSERRPKGGYNAVKQASLPLQVALEHDGKKPLALWVFNDTMQAHPGCKVRWRIHDDKGDVIYKGEVVHDVVANASQRVMQVDWQVKPKQCATIDLMLLDADDNVIANNQYERPFKPMRRPKGYPWAFDFELGTKVFDKAGAPSMMQKPGSRTYAPMWIQQRASEWAMRQHLPRRVFWLISRVLRLAGVG